MNAFREAEDRAVGFLKRQIGPNYLWEDFGTRSHSIGKDYPTCHIAVCMIESGVDLKYLKPTAMKIALKQDDHGGWGFNREMALPDADTTAFAIMLLEPFGYGKRIEKAKRFLFAHRQSDGGFSTYNDPEAIAAVYEVPEDGSYEGWCSSHPDVTATVLQALGEDNEAVQYLKNVQQEDGRWKGYWWVVPSYATAQAILALKGKGCEPEIEKARGWLAKNCKEPKQPLHAAFSLIGLAGSEAYRSEANYLAQYLVEAQTKAEGELEDGSWESHPSMRLPDGRVMDPETDQKMYKQEPMTDERRTFTTANCLRALSFHARHVDR